MFCNKCGKELTIGERFCNQYGTTVNVLEEMIRTADQYQSKGAFTTNNRKLPFQLIIDTLNKDESVIFAFGANAATIGRTSYQYVALAFTNKRLLIAGKPNSLIGGLMDAEVKSIKLDKINSIGVFGMCVRLDTIGDEDIVVGSYSSEIRSKLSIKIQQVVDEYQKNMQSSNTTTVIEKSEVEKIKEYKELLDSGIITQEEFEKKKKELLNL